MNVNNLLSAALDKIMEQNSAVLTANGVSVTVYISYNKTRNRTMEASSYTETLDDVMVIGHVADMNSLNITPMLTPVTLGGVDYMAGQTMTTTPGYVSLWLRAKN